MKFTTTPHARKFFLLILVINLLLCGSYFGLRSVIQGNIEQAKTLRAEIVAEENSYRQLLAAREALAEVTAQSEKISSYGVGDVEQQVFFLSSIEELARSQGVSIEIKEPRVVSGDRDYFSMSIWMKGGWQNMVRYLMLLETIPMNIMLDGLKLNSQSPGGVWNGDIELKVLKFK